MVNKINIEYTDKGNISENNITFDIKGTKEDGLHKTVVNSIRRVLLSSIPTVGFRTDMNNTDIKIIKNTTSLHNEYLLHRISMIPLYINPIDYNKDYLFKLVVSSQSDKPIITITANDFEIYPRKEVVQNNNENEIDFENYMMDKPLSLKQKKEIFRPFQGTEFCMITELKSSKSSIREELELYGIPRVSYAYEDARWQAVSCATYSFKRDDELFKQIIQEKMKIENIKEEDAYDFSNRLYISESERYFHRDVKCEPYWYEFKLNSTHYLSSKQLFIQATEILSKQLELLKEDLPKTVSEEDSRITIEELSKNIYKLVLHGNDDTIGSILQSYISNKIINEGDSGFVVCGYKKSHPLEDIIYFNISLEENKKSTQENIISIIELFSQACQKLIHPYNITINPLDIELLKENLNIIESLGYQIDEIKNNLIVINGIPAGLETQNNQELFEFFLEELKNKDDNIIDKIINKIATQSACYASKNNNKFHLAEEYDLKRFINNLLNCKMPFMGIHGKPCVINIEPNIFFN